VQQIVPAGKGLWRERCNIQLLTGCGQRIGLLQP
jgi:hypothetical protein